MSRSLLLLLPLASALTIGGAATRRQAIASFAASAASFALPPIALADGEGLAIVGEVEVMPPSPPPAPPPPPPPPSPPTSITYSAVKELLLECKDSDECKVTEVAFTSSNGESADIILSSGLRLPILGIPPDNPTNDSSPLKLAAKCRDAKVKYTFPFSNLLRKPT